MKELTHNDVPEAVSILLEKVGNLEVLFARLCEKSETSESDTIDIEEAARLLKRKVGTIYNYVSEGKIPCRRDGKLLFSRKELADWKPGSGQKFTAR